MIENALGTLLAQATGLTNKVSPSTQTVMVNKGLPKLLYSLIVETPRYSDDGSGGPTQARYQLDIFGDNSAATRAVYENLKKPYDPAKPIGSGDKSDFSGIDNYRGTIDGTVVQRIYFDNASTQQGQHIDGQNTTIARRIVEILIEFQE